MSKAKNLVLMANAITIAETLLLGIIIFTAQVPGNLVNGYYPSGSQSALQAAILTPSLFVLCLAGQIINWIGYFRLDGISRQRWRAWFLIIGIVTLLVNPISGVLYIVAFSVANRDFEVNSGLSSFPQIGERTLLTCLDDLETWKIVTPAEASKISGDLER